MRRPVIAALFALCLAPLAASASDEAKVAPAAAADKEVSAPVAAPVVALPHAYFVNIKDGDTVKSPFKVQFGVDGMEIAPAGTDKPNTGHFHLLIDTDLADPKAAIPHDAQHLHFGKGEKEADVTLEPGKHTLQIVLADGNHVPQDPPVESDKITVTVEK